MSSIQLKYAIAALLNNTSIRPNVLTAKSTRLTIRWLREMARLQGNHRAFRRPDHVHGGLCRIDGQMASDDHGAFSSECPRGLAADAPAGASDDADRF
jgi:hypothetical protein